MRTEEILSRLIICLLIPSCSRFCMITSHLKRLSAKVKWSEVNASMISMPMSKISRYQGVQIATMGSQDKYLSEQTGFYFLFTGSLSRLFIFLLTSLVQPPETEKLYSLLTFNKIHLCKSSIWLMAKATWSFSPRILSHYVCAPRMWSWCCYEQFLLGILINLTRCLTIFKACGNKCKNAV